MDAMSESDYIGDYCSDLSFYTYWRDLNGIQEIKDR